MPLGWGTHLELAIHLCAEHTDLCSRVHHNLQQSPLHLQSNCESSRVQSYLTVIHGLPSPAWVTALHSLTLGSPRSFPLARVSTFSLRTSHWPLHLTSFSDSSLPWGITGSSEGNKSGDGEAWNRTFTLRRFLRPLKHEEGNQQQGCPVNIRQAQETPNLGSAGPGTYDYSGGWHVLGAQA